MKPAPKPPQTARPPLKSQAALLQEVVAGTAADTGEAFFRSLVQHLAGAMGTFGALVADYAPEQRKLYPRAFWIGGDWVQPAPYDIAGTPCEMVVESGEIFCVQDRIIERYPHSAVAKQLSLVSYLGLPFKNTEGKVIGHLAVLDRRPLQVDDSYRALFDIFAARAAAEFMRLQAEQDVRDREARLSRVIDSAMDGIIEFDPQLNISLMNSAAQRIFSPATDDSTASGLPVLAALLTADSIDKLLRFVESFSPLPQQQRRCWISGGLSAKRDDQVFPIEATLSQGCVDGGISYTLILRDVDDRLKAEQAIRELTRETEWLREELHALQQHSPIIGNSPAMQRAMTAVAQVAATDASVLIQGETGTGKELFARAIHQHSPRRDGPLITVNCAAIPRELVESEFFGHIKGAFTGATANRDGRFARADDGSIFLDEIGELPLEVQAKLLRVLQEGEFEPVGGNAVIKVNVRIIAATHRDLLAEVKAGRFREDLYYRLNVFPIQVPALRDRGDDIATLAQAFTDQLAGNQRLQPLSSNDRDRLSRYPWPGNVRELQNVIERAVITARDGHINLAQALPDALSCAGNTLSTTTAADADNSILTSADLRQLEHDNTRRALDACHWKIAGPAGAAALLGLKPSTLSARMKALGIARQRG